MLKTLTFIRRNAIALTALFVALGGTSYAALNLPAGSVGTRQLRNRAVTSKKLARGSVTAASLDPKTIAGHVALWAQIGGDGHVVSSNPRATVARFGVAGVEHVTWKRRVSSHCIALANPANVAPVPSSAYANTLGPSPGRDNTGLLVSTFNGQGTATPEDVNVIVVCP